MRNIFILGLGRPFCKCWKIHVFHLKKKQKNNAIFNDIRFLLTTVIYQMLFYTKPHLLIFIESVLYCHAAVRQGFA